MSSNSGRVFFEQFIDDYYAECEEHLNGARNLMLAIEAAGTSPVEANVLEELLRNFHSLKGLSAMVGVEEVTQLSHAIENYLRELKQPHAVPSAQGIGGV